MKKSTFGLMLLLSLTLLVGTAFAHRSGGGHGMMGGYGAGNGYGFCDRYNDVDREEVKAVTDKYASQFDALQKKMGAKRDQMLKARENDATTMGEMNKLRDEMFAIRKEHRSLAQKVDDELAEKFGDDVDGGHHYGMMGGRGHRGGMMGDRDHHDEMMGRRGGYGYGGCR